MHAFISVRNMILYFWIKKANEPNS